MGDLSGGGDEGPGDRSVRSIHGQARAAIERPADVAFIGKRSVAAEISGPYKRYAVAANGVSPMAIPGKRGGQYTADGLTHAENANPTSGAADHLKQLDKRRDKLDNFNYGDHWASVEGSGDLVVLTWGSLTTTAREAISRAAADGIKVRLVARACWPPFSRTAATSCGLHRWSSRPWRPVPPLPAAHTTAGAGARVQPARSAADHGRRNSQCDRGVEITMSAIGKPPLACKPGDYKSTVKPIWCPGCGDYHVLMSFTRAFAQLKLPPEEVVVVSGIGCSSRIPAYTNCYGFHGVHGRSLALAAGLKVTRPDLTVVVASGDGDGYSIGGNHFLHACRRNIDMTYVVMDNHIYGMTKGQPSPTTEPEFDTALSPGAPDAAFHPLVVALASGELHRRCSPATR